MTRFTTVFAVLAVVLVALAPTGAVAAAVLERTAGGDRVATAVAASREHRTNATDAVLATAHDFPDALSAGALAGNRQAPVLLTARDELPASVAEELQRLGVRTVWLLGGRQAVSSDVEVDLGAQGYEVNRLAAASRYGTAAKAALAAGPSPEDEVVLALGEHPDPERAWADAVASSALAASPQHVPTLLTRPETLPAETEEALDELDVHRVLVVGGAAAIKEPVVERLRSLGYTVARIAGASRYETSTLLAEEARQRFGDASQPVVFASGETFPDALAAGALAAELGGPVVLVPSQELAADVDRFVRDHGWTGGVVVGGPVAVSQRVADELGAALRGEPRPAAQPEPQAEPEPQPEPEPREEVVSVFEGRASWYGPGFAGRRTASGERFNPGDHTAAHRSLPFGTRVRVTNTKNGSQVVVRVNDRGPYHGGRVLDVSQAAADVLGMTADGTAYVRGEVLR